jgi:hypothetical protein
MTLTVTHVPLARLFCVASVCEENGKPQARGVASLQRAVLLPLQAPHSHRGAHPLSCRVYLRRAVAPLDRGLVIGQCTDPLGPQVRNCLELQPGALQELSLPGLGNFCFPVRQPGTRGWLGACLAAFHRPWV